MPSQIQLYPVVQHVCLASYNMLVPKEGCNFIAPHLFGKFPYHTLFLFFLAHMGHVVDAPNIRTFALPNDPITSCNEKPPFLLLKKGKIYKWCHTLLC